MNTHRRNNSVLIIGAGPSGVACAQKSLEKGFDVTILEQGFPLDLRICPAKNSSLGCIACPICSIMCGFGGAGAFSDGKFTMPQKPGPYHIGGNLPSYIGYETTNALIKSRFELGISHGTPNNLIRNQSSDFIRKFDEELEKVGLFRAAADVNHIGTSAVQALYKQYETELINAGAKIYYHTKVEDLIVSGKTVLGVVTSTGERYFADNIVIATGRSGAKWFEGIAKKYKFPRKPAMADFGFRVEVPSSVMKEVNDNLYEAKIILKRNDMSARMFCTNPNGAVVTEQADGIAFVNGHSDNVDLSNLTNFAVLVTTPRYTQEQVRKLGLRVNKLGDSQPMIQTWSDLIANKSSTREVLDLNPTLKTATPGNFRGIFPEKELSCIIEYMQALNKVIPGITGSNTLLYGLEAKFCHPGLVLTSSLQIEGWNIFVPGDAGITHGLASAEASGEFIVNSFGQG